jgi:hypothetical protein
MNSRITSLCCLSSCSQYCFKISISLSEILMFSCVLGDIMYSSMLYSRYHPQGGRLRMFRAYLVCKSAASRTLLLVARGLINHIGQIARIVSGLETACRSIPRKAFLVMRLAVSSDAVYGTPQNVGSFGSSVMWSRVTRKHLEGWLLAPGEISSRIPVDLSRGVSILRLLLH